MTTQNRQSILLIDDDRRLTTMLAELLVTEGYACVTAPNGARGLLLLEEHRPDLVLLDVMMPGHDGIETLIEIRQRSESVPVIMLTALGQEEHRIRGLEAGADDYIAKPFAARELILRVQAVLKRSSEPADVQADKSRIAGPIEVRLDQQYASINGVPLDLTGTELRILTLLVEKSGALVTREQLSRYAIGRELLPDERTLDTHVSNLRRKITVAGHVNGAIRAVRGSGYRLTVS